MDEWWEWWSAANNLCGTFHTREQLIEAVAQYVADNGWAAGKWVAQEIASGPWHASKSKDVDMKSDGFQTILGPDLLKEACTYG